jgi:hypothetical protein
VTMQGFAGGYGTMIAAPVQGDVDGIPKGSHYGKSTAHGASWDTGRDEAGYLKSG